MADLDIALLRSFVVLAETASFGRTGARIGRSQSAVSAQIARLESVLGQRLVARDTRNVRLTPEGERLLPEARAMVAQGDRLVQQFRAAGIAGEVRFGSPEDFASAYLPGVLGIFVAAHPEVELHVSCQLTLHLIAEFEAGAHDLIVVKQDPARPLPGAKALWREPLVWVAAPGFVVAAGRPVPLVMSPAPCVYRARAVDAVAKAGWRWTGVYTSPSFAGAVAAVQAGLGAMVMPAAMVLPGLQTLDGWPTLAEAEMAMLVRPDAGAAVAALAAFVAERVRR
jgi:DNA-binding transcriptional LysR family regulator